MSIFDSGLQVNVGWRHHEISQGCQAVVRLVLDDLLSWGQDIDGSYIWSSGSIIALYGTCDIWYYQIYHLQYALSGIGDTSKITVINVCWLSISKTRVVLHVCNFLIQLWTWWGQSMQCIVTLWVNCKSLHQASMK